MKVEEEFSLIHPDDLWVYNKLQLSRKLNYLCGPAGAKVPAPGLYIVRPCVNFLGMGRNAEIVFLESSTEHLNTGDFWCEVFSGPHYSVDYHYGTPVLTVRGYRNVKNSLSRWRSWVKVQEPIALPSILEKFRHKYEWMNCEFIGNRLIEAHFRTNPNFKWGNTIAIPVWNDEKLKNRPNMTFMSSPAEDRLGFWIK